MPLEERVVDLKSKATPTYLSSIEEKDLKCYLFVVSQKESGSILVALLPVCISVVDDQLIAPAPNVAPVWCNCAWVLHKVVQVALHPKLTDVGGRRTKAPKKVNPVFITPTRCFVAS